MGHETVNRPFSDVHRKGDHVVATLLHDPTVEGLDVALYMDGSASMEPEYGPRGVLAKLGPVRNNVEPQMRWMLQYLATKDRNGLLRVAYWATGDGSALEQLGELTGDQAAEFKFPGPKQYGKGTVMLPVLRDYIAYLRSEIGNGAKRGLAVIITDSQLHDPGDVKAYSIQVAKEISAGRLPRLNFVLVGVGAQVDEAQMEDISHVEYPGVGHLWCHRHADRMEEMADLVAVLVDETMTVAAGGTILDEHGQVLKVYEGRLPAVLEFDVPEGCTGFVLEVNGQRFPQPLPEEHEHGEHDDDSDEHDAPPPPPDGSSLLQPPPRGHGGHRH
jgi:hypothetical protein